MLLVCTENNGLCHAVRILQIACYFMCHFSYTVFYYDVIIVVRIVIDAVFYKIAIDVFLPFRRSPLVANVRCYVYYLERSKETVFDTFF